MKNIFKIIFLYVVLMAILGSIFISQLIDGEDSKCMYKKETALNVTDRLIKYYIENGSYPDSIAKFGYDLDYIIYENKGRMSGSYRNDSCNPTCIQDFELFVRCGFTTYQYNYLSNELEQRSLYRWP